MRVRERQCFQHRTDHQSHASTVDCYRYTAATLLIEEGIDMRVIQKLLGHSNITTTEVYTKVSDQVLLAAVDRADILRLVEH